MAVDQKKKQAIILDLEMNPVPKETASASGTTREVIEIGAVRVRDNKLADRFHTFVRPSFSKTITPYIQRLTGIHDGDLRNAPSFAMAVQELSEWIGEDIETVICAWSDADRRQLIEESYAKSLKLPGNIAEFEDVQRMHFEKLGIEISYKHMALSKAALQYGITINSKKCHSALYDAEITAEIFLFLQTGRYLKQAALLRNAAREKTGQSVSGFLLGDLCKELFESMNTQAARA